MKLTNWFAVVGCVGAAFGATVASQGCTATVVAGTDDGGGPFAQQGDDSGSPVVTEDAGSVPFDPCTSCQYQQCTGLFGACATNADCLAIYQCAIVPSCAGDTTGACVTNCMSANPNGQSLYIALGSCDLVSECNGAACAATCNPSADICAIPDGGTGSDDSGSAAEDAATGSDDGGTAADSAVSLASLPCDQCQPAACSSQISACAMSTPCGQYNECVLGCTTADCTTACQTGNPTGYTAAQSLGSCTSSSCPQCSQ